MPLDLGDQCGGAFKVRNRPQACQALLGVAALLKELSRASKLAQGLPADRFGFRLRLRQGSEHIEHLPIPLVLHQHDDRALTQFGFARFGVGHTHRVVERRQNAVQGDGVVAAGGQGAFQLVEPRPQLGLEFHSQPRLDLIAEITEHLHKLTERTQANFHR